LESTTPCSDRRACESCPVDATPSRFSGHSTLPEIRKQASMLSRRSSSSMTLPRTAVRRSSRRRAPIDLGRLNPNASRASSRVIRLSGLVTVRACFPIVPLMNRWAGTGAQPRDGPDRTPHHVADLPKRQPFTTIWRQTQERWIGAMGQQRTVPKSSQACESCPINGAGWHCN